MRITKAIGTALAGYVGWRAIKKAYDMTQPQEIYLAKTIWGEARGEGAEGMQAVANVIMNRVDRGGWYGLSVKDVVLKPYQFSCWNAGDPNRVKLDNLTLAELSTFGALEIAQKAIAGQLPDITGGATEYHAANIKPNWDWSKLQKTVQIGNHIFYRSV